MSFMLFAVLVIALFPSVAFSESSKKHPSPCHIAYPSDATIEWDCRTLRPGESLEKLFGERWIDVARFNRIDRRHARSGASFNVPKRLDDLEFFVPLPLWYPLAELNEQFALIDPSEPMSTARYGLRCRLSRVTEAMKRRPAISGSRRRIERISLASTRSKERTGLIP